MPNTLLTHLLFLRLLLLLPLLQPHFLQLQGVSLCSSGCQARMLDGLGRLLPGSLSCLLGFCHSLRSSLQPLYAKMTSLPSPAWTMQLDVVEHELDAAAHSNGRVHLQHDQLRRFQYI